MKLCMMSCMMLGADPRTIVETAVECGMSAIDWTCSHQYAPAAELRRMSVDSGLRIAAHTVLGSTFLSRDAKALDDFKRSLDFAVDLGAPILMLPPFARKDQVSKMDDRKAWIDFYAQILPFERAYACGEKIILRRVLISTNFSADACYNSNVRSTLCSPNTLLI